MTLLLHRIFAYTRCINAESTISRSKADCRYTDEYITEVKLHLLVLQEPRFALGPKEGCATPNLPRKAWTHREAAIIHNG